MDKFLRKLKLGLWTIIVFIVFMTLTVSFEFLITFVDFNAWAIPRTKAKDVEVLPLISEVKMI